MPQFLDHIKQAKNNLSFLEFVNTSSINFYDWQVTSCYYVAVHLINAHLSMHNMQYRKHVDIKNAINPEVAGPSSFNESLYLAYTKLENLSRRSRYLVSEKNPNDQFDEKPHFIFDVHLKKALAHLHTLIVHFNKEYGAGLGKIKISCPSINTSNYCFCN